MKAWRKLDTLTRRALHCKQPLRLFFEPSLGIVQGHTVLVSGCIITRLAKRVGWVSGSIPSASATSGSICLYKQASRLGLVKAEHTHKHSLAYLIPHCETGCIARGDNMYGHPD